MISKNFRLNILVRVLIIFGLAMVFAFVLIKSPRFFVLVSIFFVIVSIVINLIRYIEKSNRDLTHFLLSIRQGAFTENYTSGNRGKQHEELSEVMNEVVREFANLNAEKELHYQYLQALNENINVAILSFDADNKLVNQNSAAKRLLNKPFFSKLEHFKLVDVNLYESIIRVRPDERMVTKVFINEGFFQLGIQVKEIVLQGKPLRIFLLQNLGNELEAREIEAWQQLIRVLTHEIMNSVTPIVSLTGAVGKILTNESGTRKDLKNLNEENMEDIFSSLSTIAYRSKGLLKFVNAYKAYSQPIELHPETFDLIILVNRVTQLLTPDLDNLKIQIAVHSQYEPIIIKADVSLIEQVLINLLKNAMEAVRHDSTGKVSIEISTSGNNHVSISVTDNGAGIEREILDHIFIPFFTTKSKGTGIGLSLSKQIMKMHHGNIFVKSGENSGSVFTIEWLRKVD
jgi:two-component system nitrogen regulation sensor histidine kinase NtrY